MGLFTRGTLLFWFGLLAVCACASTPVRITDTAEVYFISLDHIRILTDQRKAWTIDDVASPALREKFAVNRLAEPFSLPNTQTWVRFRLVNGSAKENFVLHIFSHEADEVELFVPGESGYVSQLTGSALPFFRRQYLLKGFAFNVYLPRGGSGDYYIRFRSSGRIHLTSELRTHASFTSSASSHYYALGLMYGIIVAVAIYNLFILISIREEQYKYYLIYLCCLLLYQMHLDGTAFQYLWPAYPRLNTIALPVLNTAFIVSALLFARSFLHTAQLTPRFDKLIVAAIWAKLLLLLVRLTFGNSLSYSFYYDLIPLLLPYAASILVFRRGYRPARFYIAAFSLLYAGYLILIGQFLHVFSFEPYAYQALDYGVVCECLLLSVALADRIRIMKRQREKAQQDKIEQLEENHRLKDRLNEELEQKVWERTQALRQANEEISRMNALLSADNKKLAIDVREIEKARVMLKGVSFDEFRHIYPDENSCLTFLAELKWKEGFRCKSCGHDHYGAGRSFLSRRCTRCGYLESVTTDTIFYRLKFPIDKAFYMIFLVAARRDITAEELSCLLTLRLQTCWAFRGKILKALKEKKLAKSSNQGWEHLILK